MAKLILWSPLGGYMNAKVCSDCKKLKHKDEFHLRRDRPDQLQYLCKECKQKIYQEYRADWKVWFAANGFNHCVICGYTGCFDALSAHHLDPDKKDQSIASMIGFKKCRPKNQAKVLAELAKCVILDETCHRELHAGYGIFSMEGGSTEGNTQTEHGVHDRPLFGYPSPHGHRSEGDRRVASFKRLVQWLWLPLRHKT